MLTPPPFYMIQEIVHSLYDSVVHSTPLAALRLTHGCPSSGWPADFPTFDAPTGRHLAGTRQRGP